MFDPVTILTAFIPTIQYVAGRIVDKYTGGPAPSNAQEAIQLMNAETEKLKALSDLDNADGAAQWVQTIKGLQRPFAVVLILSAWYFVALRTGIQLQDLENLASAVIFYLFGQRTQMILHTNKRVK